MKYFITLLTTLLALVLTGNSFASDTNKTATAQSYFDVATGHRYIKNPDSTYKEFTKKGELFRASLSPDLPLLTSNKYIQEIGQDCFMIYQKSDQRILKMKILPASNQHPKGWLAKTAIECLKNGPDEKESAVVSIGNSKAQAPFDENGEQVATGESYLDVATGHRYIKNSDATYREYTKKGELFRASVSPKLALLTTSKNILEIGQHCYLLYQRNKNFKNETLVLPSNHKHPYGWSIENILISMIQ